MVPPTLCSHCSDTVRHFLDAPDQLLHHGHSSRAVAAAAGDDIDQRWMAALFAQTV
jgi:hypothetical protein